MNNQFKWYINSIEHARNLGNFNFIYSIKRHAGIFICKTDNIWSIRTDLRHVIYKNRGWQFKVVEKLYRINNNLHLKSFPFLLVLFQIITIPRVGDFQTKVLCTYLFWHFCDKHNYCVIYWIWWGFQVFHLPLPKPISSTEHIPVSFSVSSSSFKLFVGFCLKYIFWLPGQIFAASLRITAILLKCETNSNNLPFLIMLVYSHFIQVFLPTAEDLHI